MWRKLGFHDFEHFVLWCPGCFGIMVGAGITTLVMGTLWWAFG